jgi:hypothetical protein
MNGLETTSAKWGDATLDYIVPQSEARFLGSAIGGE